MMMIAIKANNTRGNFKNNENDPSEYTLEEDNEIADSELALNKTYILETIIHKYNSLGQVLRMTRNTITGSSDGRCCS